MHLPVLQENKNNGLDTYGETEAIERCAYFVPNSCPVPGGSFVHCFLPLGYTQYSPVFPLMNPPLFELFQVDFCFLQTPASTANLEN